MSETDLIKSIAIIGGGSAGWMTAAALSRMLNGNDVEIILVESEEIGTVGVGEATIPDIKNFNRMLGINEHEFIKETNATFKLGIEFSDWNKIGDRYFHPFGSLGVDMNGIDFHQYWLHHKQLGSNLAIENYSLSYNLAKDHKFTIPENNPRSILSQFDYAYHFDATAYAQYLRRFAESGGVKRIEGKVNHVSLCPDSGNISLVSLENGTNVGADLFFDCSGFKALLINKALNVKYNDWRHWLPCNRAQAIPSEHSGSLKPYTTSTAKKSGWQWRIPTQNRTGNGHIYCSDFINDDEAHNVLLEGLDGNPLSEARTIHFKTGCREYFWYKNCIGVGLSSGFLEPLESTSIYLIQQAVSHFISLYPNKKTLNIAREKYNHLMSKEFEQVRDFIILHYKATTRDDSPFWDYCRNMPIPESLQHKIELFKSAGRVFRDNNELFAKPNWIAVMLGQGIIPQHPEPMLNGISKSDLDNSLGSMRKAMQSAASRSPMHEQFVTEYSKVD